MTIENMNSATLVPKKDYTQNRVMAGMLQLARGTTLVLDETALQQGQLNPQGACSNVRRSGRIMRKSHDLVLRYRHLKMGINYTNENFFFVFKQKIIHFYNISN